MRYNIENRPKNNDTRVVNHFAWLPVKCEVIDPDTGLNTNKFITVWLENFFTKERYSYSMNVWLYRFHPLVYDKMPQVSVEAGD